MCVFLFFLFFCFCFSAVFIYFGLFSKSLFGRGGADSLTRSRTQIVFPLLCNKPSLSLSGCVCVCVFITGEGESQNKGKQIWSYEERR